MWKARAPTCPARDPPAKRQAMVAEIQKRLELDAARPIFAWDLDYFAMRPYVHGFVPHNNVYNNGRLQDVWMSR